MSTLDLVVIRTWGAAILLFAASWMRRTPEPRAKLTGSDLWQIFVYSLLGASINQICFLEGLARSTATNAALVLVAIPVLTLGIAVLLGRERASATAVLGIAVGLSGALWLILPRGTVEVTGVAAAGNLFLLGSATAYALYLVLTRPILARHDPLRVVSWVFLFAALMVTPFDMKGLTRLFSTGISAPGWLSIAYVIVGATALPYLLNSWALVRVKSSLVAIYILLQPIFAGVLGRVVLHERLGPRAAIAGGLVVAGVLISAWRRA